ILLHGILELEATIADGFRCGVVHPFELIAGEGDIQIVKQYV
ncbi:hypothetical protein HMPREF9446_02572, partial [Bacteroides fluxus YIT 12057]